MLVQYPNTHLYINNMPVCVHCKKKTVISWGVGCRNPRFCYKLLTNYHKMLYQVPWYTLLGTGIQLTTVMKLDANPTTLQSRP
jgi:hypothetical protein